MLEITPADVALTLIRAGGIAARRPTGCLRLTPRSPTALQLLYLASDAGPRKPAADRSVTDAVIGSQSPQRLTGQASVHQRHIGCQSPQSRTIGQARSSSAGVVVVCAHQDCRVNVSDEVLEGA